MGNHNRNHNRSRVTVTGSQLVHVNSSYRSPSPLPSSPRAAASSVVLLKLYHQMVHSADLHSRLQQIYRNKKMGHKASLVGATHHHHDTPLQHHHHHTPLQQMYRHMGISAGRHSDLQQLYHLMGLGYREGYRESSSYTNKYSLPALSLSAAPEEEEEEEKEEEEQQQEQQQEEEEEEDDHSDLLTTGPMVGNNNNTDVITMQWDGADFIIQDLLQMPIVKHREGNNTEPEPETEEISNDQSH